MSLIPVGHGQLLTSGNYKVFVFCLQEAFVTSEEFGQDLEHVEVLQKKFDEFQKVTFLGGVATVRRCCYC